MLFTSKDRMMKISIDYDSCWQTSFLSGDPNKPISKKNNERKFIATTKTRGEKPTPITNDTVYGILCRILGDQRKLYQAKQSDNYFLHDLEDKISWQLVKRKTQTTTELMYLTNKSDDRCGQSTWLGVLPDNIPWFFSDEAPLLWSVLFFSKEQLLDFILQEKAHMVSAVNCKPTTLIARINELTDSKSSEGAILKTKVKILSEKDIEIDKKNIAITKHKEKISSSRSKTKAQEQKGLEKLDNLKKELQELKKEKKDIEINDEIMVFNDKLTKVTAFLSSKYPNKKKKGEEYCKEGVTYPSSLYSAALYLQAERLLNSNVNIDFVKNKKGDIQIQGFSKRGFNGVRDWLNSMTGNKKKAVGTPCQVNKQSGRLEIEIDIDKTKGKEIVQMIENAGVSSFYLGKKGLAYVSKIRA